MVRLLFIEDEIDLGSVIKQYLEINSFEVDWEKNGKSAFERITNQQAKYDLVIIDVSIPEMDGFALAEHIVNIDANIPFIFLTARSERADKIRGLKIGADDYITKPFDIDELILRIKNIIKRNVQLENGSNSNESNIKTIISKGDILFDKSVLKLSINNIATKMLTIREAELLEYFFNNENTILKREDILVELWGRNDYFLGRSLDVFVSRIRKYLSPSKCVSITNVYGIGYIFKVEC